LTVHPSLLRPFDDLVNWLKNRQANTVN